MVIPEQNTRIYPALIGCDYPDWPHKQLPFEQPLLNIEVDKMDVLDTIKQQISENAVILYMKGSPSAPQCGFSQRASQALMACGQRFAYVDILSNPEIRAELPKYANWPTFPQLWVKGELIGGCDIITEMNEKGELKPLVDAAVAG
jgi:monothiol glutaredoxin